MRHLYVFLPAALAALCVACSAPGDMESASKTQSVASNAMGDNDAPQFICSQPITDKLATVSAEFSSGCQDCDLEDAKLLTDEHPDNAAVMHLSLPARGDSAALRIKAQPGIVYPSGTQPGVLATFPEGRTTNTTLVNFFMRTYLGGELQQKSDSLLGTSLRTGGVDNSMTYYYIDADKPYDEIEFVIQTRSGSASYTAQFFEACTDWTTGDP